MIQVYKNKAAMDYWFNVMDGQPFMVINKPIDSGMISKAIENEILP